MKHMIKNLILFLACGALIGAVCAGIYGLIKFNLYPTHERHQVYEKIFSIYQAKVKKLVPSEITNLAMHKNDWHYCTMIGLPAISDNDPKAIAQHIAYYQWGSKYCALYWSKAENICTKLEKTGPVENENLLNKDIAICNLAKNTRNEFKKYLPNAAGKMNHMEQLKNQVQQAFTSYRDSVGKSMLYLCTQYESKKRGITMSDSFTLNKNLQLKNTQEKQKHLYQVLRQAKNEFGGKDLNKVITEFFIYDSTNSPVLNLSVNTKICQQYEPGFYGRVNSFINKNETHNGT